MTISEQAQQPHGVQRSAVAAPNGHRQPAAPLERAIGWSLVIFISVLVLEWITLSGFAGGFVKPFHVAAVGIGVAACARWRPGPLISPVLRRFGPIYGSYALLLALAMAGGLYYVTPYMNPNSIMRSASYMAVSVLIAGVLAAVATSARVQRILAWSAAATVSVASVGITLSLALQGANPITIIREAFVKVDPDILIYQLLRLAFRSEEDLATVGANLRHKVFLAVLLGSFLGLAFLPVIARSRRALRGLLIGSGLFGCVLVLLSLSRSAILCMVVPFVLMIVRLVARNRARAGQMAFLGLVVLGLVALAVSPVPELLEQRFFESTTSYENRLSGAGPQFLDRMDNTAVVGAPQLSQGAPHVFILDAWYSGGVLAFLCAVIMLVYIALLWVRMFRSYMTGAGRWLLPADQLWLLGIGVIPIVRAFTAGNQFHMVEWACVGVFVGITMANDRLVGAARARATAELAPSSER
jgi:hypothetical protein